jgi:hypothetical protein
MAIVNQKYLMTVTDDTSTDPVVDVEVNFTDNSADNYSTATLTFTPGATGDLLLDVDRALIDLSADGKRFKYLSITVDNPLYVWVGRRPERVGGVPGVGQIDLAITPEIRVYKHWSMEGPTGGVSDKIYAINPSRASSFPGGTNLTVHVKVVYTYE